MPSEKILEQKKQAAAELSESLKSACAGVIVSYKGTNVADDTKLRRELREAGSQYRVVKNTLLSRALKDAGIDGLDHVLKGATAIAMHKDDYVSSAKILSGFANAHENFEIKAGFVDGSAVDAAAVKELAELPPKEVLVAKALGGLNAPISGFVSVLSATMRGLVVALNAIAEKQGASA